MSKVNKEALFVRVRDRLKNEGVRTATTELTTVMGAVEKELHAAVIEGEQVRLFGLGYLKVYLRDGRTGVDPRTREPIKIAPRYILKLDVSTPVERALKLKAEAEITNSK